MHPSEPPGHGIHDADDGLDSATPQEGRFLDETAHAFTVLRPRLRNIAFRVLRDDGEAEDVVQDIWLRWQSVDRSVIDSPPAFLATATRRLALNVAVSARHRRETLVESGMPDPVDLGVSPQSSVERDEQIAEAVSILLERLNATECAVFMLREGFGYPYRQIAKALGLETANTRQIASRARQRVNGSRRARVDPVLHGALTTAFGRAARTGNLQDLVAMLSDGGRDQRAG